MVLIYCRQWLLLSWMLTFSWFTFDMSKDLWDRFISDRLGVWCCHVHIFRKGCVFVRGTVYLQMITDIHSHSVLGCDVVMLSCPDFQECVCVCLCREYNMLSFLDSRSDRGWRIPPGRDLFIISYLELFLQIGMLFKINVVLFTFDALAGGIIALWKSVVITVKVEIGGAGAQIVLREVTDKRRLYLVAITVF